MSATYRHDYAAFDRVVLCGGFMVAEMLRRAEAVKARAEVTAPYDPNDPDLIHYRDHFTAEAFVGESENHTIRAIGRVSNDDMPTAEFVEFGTVHNPRHRTLGNALDAASL